MKPHFKPITPDESNLLKAVFQENAKEFDYPWHFHPEFELTYIVASRGMRYVGNNMENFSLINISLGYYNLTLTTHQKKLNLLPEQKHKIGEYLDGIG